MNKPRSDGQETRRHLLTAACEMFGRRGFKAATIAEICRKAGANIAAANYHFGSKEALYMESWRFAFEKSLSIYPPDGGVAADASVEERLRGRILAIMRRIMDPESHCFDIAYQELANPTGLLVGVVQESIEPIFGGFMSIVRELLGEDAAEEKIRLCLMSIRAQCFGPLLQQRRRKMGPQGLSCPGLEPSLEDVEMLADHVTAFSLAGIRAVRQAPGERKSLHK